MLFNNFVIVLTIAFLEGVLSVDNALVLALLVKKLPKEQHRKALTYGIWSAFIFRAVALLILVNLMRFTIIKFLGGAYLLYIGIKYFVYGSVSNEYTEEGSKKKRFDTIFWSVVLAVELTDVAFAVDSIMAAVAMSTKFWIVFTGGVLGIIFMRFAATFFIKLLEKFPRMENTAYALIVIIGVKLIVVGINIPGLDFQSTVSPAFWVFWSIMLVTMASGFIPTKASINKKHCREN
jgi:YkoY family integral membrane protein